MTEAEIHIRHLRAAEGQFRLATAVRLAVTIGHQPLDLPIQWSHGKHVVSYSEIALSREEADFAAWNLQRSATFLMASGALESIRGAVQNPKAISEPSIGAAYQIARMIRNAFAHGPFNPVWRIDEDCRDRRFEIPDVIELDTTALDATPFDWRHYGGPLALLRLSQFVRTQVLGDNQEPARVIPLPKRFYYQQGDLILMKVDEIPSGAVPVEGTELLGRHVIGPSDKE